MYIRICMCMYVHTYVCVYISKESELLHSIGSLIDQGHPCSRINRDYMGRYCPKTFETAKGKKENWCHWE